MTAKTGSNVMDAFHSAHEREHGPGCTVSRDEIVSSVWAAVFKWVADGSPYHNLPMIPQEVRDACARDAARRIAAGYSAP